MQLKCLFDSKSSNKILSNFSHKVKFSHESKIMNDANNIIVLSSKEHVNLAFFFVFLLTSVSFGGYFPLRDAKDMHETCSLFSPYHNLDYTSIFCKVQKHLVFSIIGVEILCL